MSYPPPPEGESSQPGSSDPQQQPGQPGQPPYGQPGYGQPPYGQPGYGQPGQGQPYGYDPTQPYYDPNQPYGHPQGQQPYGYGQATPYQQGYYPGGPRPEHPGAVPSLVIGLIALLGGFFCLAPALLGPWAWVKGSRTMKEIDASGGQVGGRGMAQAGFICGILGTALGVLYIIGLVILIALAATGSLEGPPGLVPGA
jgi:hypothetical protein